MSSSSPEGTRERGVPTHVEAAPGVRLLLPPLEGAREEPANALPAIDLSAIPGARVTLRRGVVAPGGEARLRALCVTAPSDRWAPGAEELVMDRASAIARGAVAGPAIIIDRWDAAPPTWTGERFDQRFEASARDGGATLAIRGRHLLGFAGEDRAAVLCSVLCAEPAPDQCGALVDGVVLEGSLAPPPPPGLLVRGILFAAEHPYPTVAILAAAGVGLVALLLARRPRPRPTR